MLRILIVEGNTAEARQRTARGGGTVANEMYAAALRHIRGDLALDVVFPADAGTVLPDASALAAYDGIAWTGSALNIYNGGPEIDRQVAFCRTCFSARVPQFGSCWGLQVGVTAIGGTVLKNPLGREIGLARKVILTEAGRAHPLYRGRPTVFDAIAVHKDIVTALPEDARILAYNSMARVQAAEFSRDGGEFWGVQYHPEYNFTEIAASMRRYTAALVEDGLFENEAAALEAARIFAGFDTGGTPETRWLAGVDADVLDRRERLRDLENWMAHVERVR
jgi:GMP synthase (glutamine-hydrolysing)